MSAEAVTRDRPIRFRGDIDGHTTAQAMAEQCVRHGVRRLVFARIGRPGIPAIDAGQEPPVGQWGVGGRMDSLRLGEEH
ncbi:MAG: hypothetical protein HOY79_52185 [Streptomyces sp.]|nr:hypothetical protein [Streptomyces sp.]